MAFASVGTIGSNSSVAADQSSLAITTTAVAEVDRLVTVHIALDNNQTTDGDEGAVSSVTDSAGNTYSKGGEFCNGNGLAQAGATISEWYSVITTQLASGGAITANFTNNTSRDSVAMSAWKFTKGAGTTVSVEATNSVADDAASSVSALDATTANIECLRLRGVASETNAANGFIATASWTAFTQKLANNAGGPLASIFLHGEFRIFTGTGASSAPTYTPLAVDHASVYVALKETGGAAGWGPLLSHKRSRLVAA